MDDRIFGKWSDQEFFGLKKNTHMLVGTDDCVNSPCYS